jgi:alpha-D-ribose 1-methylphosphonate 5-triphosphate diphosphatase PhnM
MNTDELTQIVTAHQIAIARHDQWQAEQEAASRQHNAEMAEIRATLAAIASQQALNTQEISRLTAGMIDLRDQVSNFVRSQEQPGTPEGQ